MYQCIDRTASNLQWLRKQINITRETLAVLLNEEVKSIEQWENGEKRPDLRSFRQLCHFFELDKSSILLFDLSREQLFTSKKLRFVQKKLPVRKRRSDYQAYSLHNFYL